MKADRLLFSFFLITALALAGGPVFATEAPILDFDLRQESGTTVVDSASGIVGTTHGTVWSTDPSGRPVLYFDNSIKYWFGDGDWFEIPDHAALDSPEITLESWVYPMSSGYYTVFAERIHDGGAFQFSIYLGLNATGYHSGTKPTLRLDYGGSYIWKDVSSPTDITLNEWHHIVGTYDGNALALYVDGEHVATDVVGGPRSTGSNPLYLGHAPTGNHYFNGYFARFKMYDRALSADEVATNFISEYEGPNLAPVAVNDDYGTLEDTVLNVPAPGVLSNDTDSGGNPLTAVLDSTTSNGGLTLNDDGSFTYTPNANYCGTDSFTYHATQTLTGLWGVSLNGFSNGNPGPSSLYRIDEVTGAGTLIGTDLGYAVNSIAIDPTTGLMYASTTTWSGAFNGLLLVDTTTGTATEIGSFGTDLFGSPYRAVLGLTFDSSGQLWGWHDPNNDDAVTIDKTTGTATEVGEACGFSCTAQHVLAFDNSDVLHMVNYTQEHFIINQVTGAAVLQSDLGFTAGSGGAAFDAAGQLWAPATLGRDMDSWIRVTDLAVPSFLDIDTDIQYLNGVTIGAQSDGLDSNIATATITVACVDDPPVANDDAYDAVEDTVLNVDAPGVLANDTDIEGDALSAALESTTSNGGLTLNADGSFTYTPNENYCGLDSFTYHATQTQTGLWGVSLNGYTRDNSGPSSLYSIDEVTGAGTLIGTDLGYAVNSIAVDPTTGLMYASTTTWSGAFNGLLLIDTVAGTATEVGSYGGSFVSIVGLTFHSSGQLWGWHDPGADDPVRIDKAIGTVTTVGPGTGTAGQVLAMDPSDTLRLIQDFSVYIIDQVTGTAAFDFSAGFTAGHGGGAFDSTGMLWAPRGFGRELDSWIRVTDLTGPSFVDIDTDIQYLNGVTIGAQNDGLDSNIATVTITVECVNDAPVAVDNNYTGNEDNQIAGNVIIDDTGEGVDFDVEGDGISIFSNTNVAHGTLVLNADGSFTYDPNLNYCGPDSFDYVITDDPSATPPSLQSDPATVSLTVACVNDPPTVTSVVPAAQISDYSDYIGTVVITVNDVDNVSTTLAESNEPPLSAAGLVLTTTGCSLIETESPDENGSNCTWDYDGQVLDPGDNGYDILFTASDGGGAGSVTGTHTLTIVPEEATVVLDSDNDVALQVAEDGGDSGPFSLFFTAVETTPDLAHIGSPEFGNLNLMVPYMELVPVGPGAPIDGVCDFMTSTPPAPPAPPLPVYPGEAYGQVAVFECKFDGVPVNTYEVMALVDGSLWPSSPDTTRYYTGTDDAVLVIFDPSLGFTTGGGWFYWPGTADPELLACGEDGYAGDKTNFGFNMKYNKKRTNVQGSLLMMRHTVDANCEAAGKFRVKSNRLDGLSIGDGTDEDGAYGWAAFSGKSVFSEPGLDGEGNHPFLVYVEDHSDEGGNQDPADEFWIQVKDGDGNVVLETDGPDGYPAGEDGEDGDDVSIENGNIIVPHSNKGGGKP